VARARPTPNTPASSTAASNPATRHRQPKPPTFHLPAITRSAPISPSAFLWSPYHPGSPRQPDLRGTDQGITCAKPTHPPTRRRPGTDNSTPSATLPLPTPQQTPVRHKSPSCLADTTRIADYLRTEAAPSPHTPGARTCCKQSGAGSNRTRAGRFVTSRNEGGARCRAPYRGYCIHRPRSDIRDRARHGPLGRVAAVRGARRRPAPSVTEQLTMGEATFRQHNCGVQRPRAGRPLSECFQAAQRRSNDSAGRRNEQFVAARPLSERSIVFERLRGCWICPKGARWSH
jgi:hypothetical protein